MTTECGRLFASMPWWSGPTPGVVEILKDRSWEPFPDNAWNEWDGRGDPLKHFVDVNSIFSDGKGSLRVLDAAAPDFSNAIEGVVKLIELDIETGETRRTIVFRPEDAHSGTRLVHIRFCRHYAIMTESREGSFYVIDLRDNSYRRILAGHPLMRCRTADVPVIEGRRVTFQNGQAMYIHNDLLEIHQDNQTLLFMCLFGARIFRVDFDLITDFPAVKTKLQPVYQFIRKWVSGLLACVATKPAISTLPMLKITVSSVMNPAGVITPLVRDDRIIWPIALSVGPDNRVNFPSTQLNRIPMLSGGENKVQLPWAIYSYPL